MTATFNVGLTEPRDRVRQLIGDTDTTSAQLQDETIDYYLSALASELAVAYQCALDLMAKWAKMVEVTVDHQTSRAQQRFQQYKELAASLKSRMGASAVTVAGFPGIYVGGLDDTRGPYDYPGLPDLDLQDPSV